MEEHGHQSDSGNSFIPSNATSFAVKIIIESLKGSKNERLRKWGETAGDVPKAIARFGSKALDAIFSSDEKPTDETLAKVAQEIEKQPEEAVAAAGQIMISIIANVSDSRTQHQKELEGYASVMEFVCEVMRKARSSIVLLGFFQGSDCTSYWHLKRDPKITVQDDHVDWTGLELYLKWSDTLEEDVVRLNEEIRDGRSQTLPTTSYDYWKDPNIGRVNLIRRAALNVDRLSTEQPPTSPFHASRVPQSIDYLIPPGAPAVITMFKSLPIAIDIMNERRDKFEDTMKEISAIKDELPG